MSLQYFQNRGKYFVQDLCTHRQINAAPEMMSQTYVPKGGVA